MSTAGEAGVLIIGGSVGGIRTARALRESGYSGPVTVVEAEAEPPYDKPPLSTAWDDEKVLVPLLTEEQARELDIELILGRAAAALDPLRRQVVLAADAHGERAVLSYDELVIATGAAARPSPWAGPRIHVLRTIADARALRATLRRAERVLVVGAGFIGSEVAAMANQKGIQVTLVDPAPIPMARLVGEELGFHFSELHRAHGVDVHFGESIIEMEHVDGCVRAQLSDGATVLVDAVVVGIGAIVNTTWLESSGLALNDGVECDNQGRVVGTEHIHAVGDVARWYQPRLHQAIRMEHWTNAVEQANCVASNLEAPGSPQVHEPVAFVWSYQYDWKIHLFGSRDVRDTPRVIEQCDPFRLAAIWQDSDGAVTGGLTINWPKASVQLRRAIPAGTAAAQVHAQLDEGAVRT